MRLILDGGMHGWKVPGISMKSSRLGCSGMSPGWIMSALLVYTEEGTAEGRRCLPDSASLKTRQFISFFFLQGPNFATDCVSHTGIRWSPRLDTRPTLTQSALTNLDEL